MAIMKSPMIQITTGGRLCVILWYWKDDAGSSQLLLKQLRQGSSNGDTLIFIEGGSGGQWVKLQADLAMEGNSSIGIYAKVYGGWHGTTAIDDIKTKDGLCNGDGQHNGSLTCDFEDSSACGFHNENIGSSFIPWTWASGMDPPYDHSTGTREGHKFIIRMEFSTPNKVGKLSSPWIIAMDNYFCFTFWYYLKGSDTANLKVYSWQDSENSILLWERYDDHGKEWHGASVYGTIDKELFTYKV
ncbi:unnamed protein product, partial [Meganyctiphanes norvegica]